MNQGNAKEKTTNNNLSLIFRGEKKKKERENVLKFIFYPIVSY